MDLTIKELETKANEFRGVMNNIRQGIRIRSNAATPEELGMQFLMNEIDRQINNYNSSTFLGEDTRNLLLEFIRDMVRDLAERMRNVRLNNTEANN